jgi:phosphoadenosine phosphosulfate reductase
LFAEGTLGRVAVVSSFGTESAVLLHLVAQAVPATPVIFVDTLKMFDETLAYRETLIESLGLTDNSVVTPDPAVLAAKDETGLRWSYDPDGCCAIRKVEPLARAKVGLDSWISGRKAFQSVTRQNLPRHPLEAQGFHSVGCPPCTSPVLPGEDPRAGRWRGWDKTECGIHLPGVPDSDDGELPPGYEPAF